MIDEFTSPQHRAQFEALIGALLRYMFDEIHWDFDNLTAEEQEIVGNQEVFDKMNRWARWREREAKGE